MVSVTSTINISVSVLLMCCENSISFSSNDYFVFPQPIAISRTWMSCCRLMAPFASSIWVFFILFFFWVFRAFLMFPRLNFDDIYRARGGYVRRSKVIFVLSIINFCEFSIHLSFPSRYGMVGSPLWMAPEMIRGDIYTYRWWLLQFMRFEIIWSLHKTDWTSLWFSVHALLSPFPPATRIFF